VVGKNDQVDVIQEQDEDSLRRGDSMGSNLNPFQEIDDFVGLGKPEEPAKPPKIEIDNLLDDDIDNLVDTLPVNQNNDDIHNLLDSEEDEEEE